MGTSEPPMNDARDERRLTLALFAVAWASPPPSSSPGSPGSSTCRGSSWESAPLRRSQRWQSPMSSPGGARRPVSTRRRCRRPPCGSP